MKCVVVDFFYYFFWTYQMLVVYLQRKIITDMNYYIIARKDKHKKVEYLKVFECKKHKWSVNIEGAMVFDRDQMNDKCKTLTKYGRKDCTYFPVYMYQQDKLFKEE